jgi:two-component system nitrogen regulation sensor histidine kinase NtrY
VRLTTAGAAAAGGGGRGPAGGGGEGGRAGGAEGDAGGGGEGEEREWTLVWVPVPGAGDPAALLVVEDATETLRGERLEAWAEMARIIAHEIKNPLTPIRLNVEHMQQVWRDRAARAAAAGGGAADPRFAEVFARCTDNVLAQVDELQQIAAEFSTYSRIPKIDPQPGDLVALVEALAAPYRAAPPPGVTIEVEVPAEPLTARFDRRLLSRALRNLIENALRASSGGGRVVLRVERGEAGDGAGGGAEARVAVLDSGPGVAPALLPRIFDPYFSTHDTGTGLGLPIARRIAEEHGGAIGARNRPEGGLEVVITLPLPSS